MTAPKDEHLALSSGINLAGEAIGYFYKYGRNIIEMFHKEIIDVIVKPNKITSVHWYLSHFQDVSEDINKVKEYGDELEDVFNFISRILNEVNLKTDLPVPNFENCPDKWHEDCSCDCNDIVKLWESFVDENHGEINDLIIHSAFQVIFLDKKFLHDFHLELADFIEVYMDEIKLAHPNYVTEKNRIKRQRFPKWLTNAVFHRDKGTCTNSKCRCDLTKLIRPQNTIHIDHIVPLQLFGSNDASNFQLLCESCNTSKGARSTETSSVNVPFWNLD
ncbi:hypothetical protein IIO_06622 [Bacillus cereus VD115]|nr:hypothetical protein IIO_06622 [Bacillus cereus VD115]